MLASVDGTKPSILDLARVSRDLPQLAQTYATGVPYPHIVFDDFLDPSAAQEAASAFPAPASEEWLKYRHVNEDKLACQNRALIPQPCLRIIDELNSPEFCRFLSTMTGIDNIIPDESLDGGGLHQTVSGGFLNVHVDYAAHPRKTTWSRRVNVLVYLNPDWKTEYGGEFEMWDESISRCVKKVEPIMNRCVVFTTDERSYHGVPRPLTTPPGTTRKSIALYYFTDSGTVPFTRATRYRATPSDGLIKRFLIAADNRALGVYHWMRNHLAISDKTVSSMLALIFRTKK